MGGPKADLSIEEGVETPILCALLGDDGPTGTYFALSAISNVRVDAEFIFYPSILLFVFREVFLWWEGTNRISRLLNSTI